jgi:hypothetical protein
VVVEVGGIWSESRWGGSEESNPTGAPMQKTHEENRANMAVRLMAAISVFAFARGMDPLELVVHADLRDWILYARLAKAKADYSPSRETRDVVKNAFREAAAFQRGARVVA